MMRNQHFKSTKKTASLGARALLAVLLVFVSMVAYGQKPNVLMIVADDLGINDLNKRIKGKLLAPHIVQLVKSGAYFERHYTAGDICAPTRASLLTGMYPQRLQYRIGHRGLAEEVRTLADVMGGGGYSTSHIGKWHLGHEFAETYPTDQGYDDFFGFLIAPNLKGINIDGTGKGPTYNDPLLYRNEQAPKRYNGNLTEILTKSAIDKINQNDQNQPWFISLWYFAPHVPYEAPQKWTKKYSNIPSGPYYAMVGALDEGIGRLSRALHESGQADNTIIVFLSDNGAIDQSSNDPYRGLKNSFMEGGVRTPLSIIWPEQLKPTSVKSIVSSMDVYPTILSLVGLKSSSEIDGQDISPLITNDLPVSRPLFWEAYEVSDRGVFDLGMAFDYSVLDKSGQWKLIYENGHLQLFDLINDPSGANDVKKDNGVVVDLMVAMYEEWKTEVRQIPVKIEPKNGALLNGRDLKISEGSGYAVIRNESMQRTPGQSGFTFAVGLDLVDSDIHRQTIVNQEGVWNLTAYDNKFRLTISDETVSFEMPNTKKCIPVIISSYFPRPNKKVNYGHIDIYVEGKLLKSLKVENNIGTEAIEKTTYLGNNHKLTQPIIGRLTGLTFLNTRVVEIDAKDISSKLCDS